METRAIVFIYTGEAVQTPTLENMIIALNRDVRIEGDVEVNCFNRDEIAKAAVAELKKRNMAEQEPYSEQEFAFIYVADKIRNVKKWPFRVFCNEVTSVLRYEDEKLVKALKILGETGHLAIRKELLEKYKFVGCASQIGFLKTLGRNLYSIPYV